MLRGDHSVLFFEMHSPVFHLPFPCLFGLWVRSRCAFLFERRARRGPALALDRGSLRMMGGAARSSDVQGTSTQGQSTQEATRPADLATFSLCSEHTLRRKPDMDHTAEQTTPAQARTVSRALFARVTESVQLRRQAQRQSSSDRYTLPRVLKFIAETLPSADPTEIMLEAGQV